MTASAVTKPSNPPNRTAKISYGGQAVLEGVMMRGRTFMAVAVRAPDKSIVVTSQPLPMRLYGGIVQKIPRAALMPVSATVTPASDAQKFEEAIAPTNPTADTRHASARLTIFPPRLSTCDAHATIPTVATI